MADITGIGTAVTGVKDILGMFFPDKTEEEKMKMQQALLVSQQLQDAANIQAQTNLEEAKQPGMHFRDAAGWTCVAGFAVSNLKPLIEWGFTIAGHPVTLPPIDANVNSTMLYALLGLGTLHATPAIASAFKGN